MKVYLRTFGCRANQYDTEVTRAMLLRNGAEIVERPDDADVALFNSCAVTAEAEADLRQAVRQAERKAARSGRTLRSIVTGCAAATDRGDIRALPSVTDVIGGADLPAVADALGLRADLTERGAQTGSRALLRIQDGCDEHCTFCVTTIARGANRSRPIDSLLDEATRLAQHHPEIVITGIHIGTYGRDLGTTLGALMSQLIAHIPDVRFRLSSLEASEVDDTLRRLYEMPDRLVPYLHAPLQSGSDRVLKRMGRHWYTASTYSDAIERLVAGRSVFGLSADVIAGFPGETEADHAQTLALVERLPFTALHVFPFSLRPGTPAERLPDPVPPAEVTRRAAELRALAQEKASAYRATRAGGVADVVVQGSGGRRSGLTEDYLSVSVDPVIPRGTRLTALLHEDQRGHETGSKAGQLAATPLGAFVPGEPSGTPNGAMARIPADVL